MKLEKFEPINAKNDSNEFIRYLTPEQEKINHLIDYITDLEKRHEEALKELAWWQEDTAPYINGNCSDKVDQILNPKEE